MGENNFALNTVIAYTILANICGFSYYILLQVIKKCNPHNEALLKVLHKQSRKGLLSLLLYVLAMGSAFIHPGLSGFFIFVVAVMWLIPDRNIEKAVKVS
jgi:uncharacterized membrane protein